MQLLTFLIGVLMARKKKKRQTGRVQAKNPNDGGGWKRGEGWIPVVCEDKPHENPKKLLFVSLKECRGGILEPEGTVEIRFRKKDLVKTMRRVDPVYISLAERLETFWAAGLSLSVWVVCSDDIPELLNFKGIRNAVHGCAELSAGNARVVLLPL
ncbi:hypothetical protein Nmel_016778 [Mimus melanotis]